MKKKRKSKRGFQVHTDLKRFMKFSVSGFFNMLFDIAILVILTEIVGLYYLISVIISFSTANISHFMINKNWGFKESEIHFNRGLLKFLSFGLLGIVLTTSSMWLLTSFLGIYYITSRVIVGIFVGTLSFILNSIFTFKIPITLFSFKKIS